MPNNTVVKDDDRLFFLIDLIGKEPTEKLCEEFGGSSIYIPKKDTWLRSVRNNNILIDNIAGLSLSELRKKYNLSENTIRNILYNKA